MENEYTESVLQTGLDQQYKIFYSSEANLVEMIDSRTIRLKKTCNQCTSIGCDFFSTETLEVALLH